MKAEIESIIAKVCKDLFQIDINVNLARPDEQFGDYSSNIALQIAKQLNISSKEVAKKLATKLADTSKENVAKIDVAGPGFLNITLTDKALWQQHKQKIALPYASKTVVVEFSNPNPFKVLHAGHLYTSIAGDAIANLLEIAGGTVHRVNFGGDVGLHVGKTMWAMLQSLGGQFPEKLEAIPKHHHSEWMAECYKKGTDAYEDNQTAKTEIEDINRQIYEIHAKEDKNSPLAQIYWTTRQWSYDNFDTFYEHIGVEFDKYYPESETADIGLETVKKHIGKVFEKSDGAVIFRGEKYGLHTRVFVTSQGLPTYEAKDVGLIIKKSQDYNFDMSVIITGNEQVQYMSVVLKAIEQFSPDLVKNTVHLTHGMVRLAGDQKMSSRKGNILRAVDVLDAVQAATKAKHKSNLWDSSLGAVKYTFLKQRMSGDIIFDIDESVATEGNSGPYLQYTHARARSILRKLQPAPNKLSAESLQTDERSFLKKIGEYTEVVDKAVEELMPHYICTYLYELAQCFNRFYENNRVVDDPRQNVRLVLVESYADVLKHGLGLLNIASPEKM